MNRYSKTPYFYIIEHTSSGIYYAGSKYAKDADPNILLEHSGYLTSSNTIHIIIKKEGKNEKKNEICIYANC